MNIEDAIVNIQIPIPERLRIGLIKYTDKMATDKLWVGSGDNSMKNTEIRNVLGHHLGDTLISDIIYHHHIRDQIRMFLPNVTMKFPQLKLDNILQIDLLKYKKGFFYKQHVDYFASSSRSISFIFNLNDKYEGGDLVFLHPTNNEEVKRISLKKNSAVFFPSNFLYPHKIEPITKGIRYSTVAWIG